MSIQTFFKSLTSNSTRRPIRRSSPASRLRVEALEDRSVPAFLAPVDYPAGINQHSVVAADLNGDGHADLAVANGIYRTVSVLLGNAAGTFGSSQTFPTDGNSFSVAAGDFNGDGKTDLVTANEYASPTVLLGNGNGTFQAPQPVPLAPPEPPPGEFITSYYATDVAVADINADGNLDLLFTGEAWWYSDAETGGAYGYVAASLGQGNGTFSPSFGVLGSYGSKVAAADLNADGKVDHVTADEVRYGLGDGTFGAGQPTGMSGMDVTVADFNGDGKPDIATARSSNFQFPSTGGNVVLNNGNGTFQPPQSYVSGVDPRSVATADFNGDGKTDLVTANAGDSQGIGRTVTVCLGNGNGTFQAPLSFPGSPSGWALAGAAVADFNLDGRADVAVVDDGSNLRVLLNDGIWTSVRISDVTVSEGNTGTRSATFTVTLAAASGQTVTVAYATANGTATAGTDYTAAAGTLTFAPGETSKTITVLVNGDRSAEPNETFFVNLSNPTNAVINDGQGAGTILDDEPRISIGDVSKKEGNGNKKTLFTFTVTLSAAYDQAVTMSFRTADGTATTGDGDYVTKTGTLTFAPGETTKTITIEVKGDSKRETNEYFYLDLYGLSINGLFTKNRGVGSILNDD